MTNEKIAIQPGTVLLAEPFMLDPNFQRSVVLVCDYAKNEGCVGFILNKHIDMQIADLLQDFPDFQSKVFFGGPVQTDTIHYIHNVGDMLEDSVRIAQGVYWGGDFEKLKFLANSKLIKPNNIRFFVGYSGWSQGQLEDEIEAASWVLSSVDANYIFKEKATHLWKKVMEDKGDRFRVIAQMPEKMLWS
jgi:putative transcriptional regulator